MISIPLHRLDILPSDLIQDIILELDLLTVLNTSETSQYLKASVSDEYFQKKYLQKNASAIQNKLSELCGDQHAKKIWSSIMVSSMDLYMGTLSPMGFLKSWLSPTLQGLSKEKYSHLLKTMFTSASSFTSLSKTPLELEREMFQAAAKRIVFLPYAMQIAEERSHNLCQVMDALGALEYQQFQELRAFISNQDIQIFNPGTDDIAKVKVLNVLASLYEAKKFNTVGAIRDFIEQYYAVKYTDDEYGTFIVEMVDYFQSIDSEKINSITNDVLPSLVKLWIGQAHIVKLLSSFEVAQIPVLTPYITQLFQKGSKLIPLISLIKACCLEKSELIGAFAPHIDDATKGVINLEDVEFVEAILPSSLDQVSVFSNHVLAQLAAMTEPDSVMIMQDFNRAFHRTAPLNQRQVHAFSTYVTQLGIGGLTLNEEIHLSVTQCFTDFIMNQTSATRESFLMLLPTENFDGIVVPFW